MNDSDFEIHLRALRPAAPTPLLESRIAQALAGVPAVPASGVVRRTSGPGHLTRWLRNLSWAVAGAAAALAAMTVLLPWTPPAVRVASTPAPLADASADAFEHASASEELIATDDSTGVIETESGLVRPVRYSYRERHAWANPRTGARMEIEVPREDVYLIPVSLQ